MTFAIKFPCFVFMFIVILYDATSWILLIKTYEVHIKCGSRGTRNPNHPEIGQIYAVFSIEKPNFTKVRHLEEFARGGTSV